MAISFQARASNVHRQLASAARAEHHAPRVPFMKGQCSTKARVLPPRCKLHLVACSGADELAVTSETSAAPPPADMTAAGDSGTTDATNATIPSKVERPETVT